MLVATFTLVALWMGYTMLMWRSKNRYVLPSVAFNIALMVLMAQLVGPFVLVPGLVVAFSVVSVQQAILGRPWLVAGAGIVALVLPVVLELTGVSAATWQSVGDALSLQPALDLGGSRGVIFLTAGNIAVVVVTTLFSHKVAAQRRDAQHALAVQAWHLRHLLPST